jgi:hypothetical protein
MGLGRKARLLLYFLCLLYGGAGYAESCMNFNQLTYTVSVMMGPPQTLTLEADGSLRYESHSNLLTPEVPEIGTYRARLSAPELASLREALEAPPFQTLPDHYGHITPGDRYRRISLSSASGKCEKMVGTREPVNPDLQRVLDRLDAIVKVALRSPLQTLHMDAPRMTVTGSEGVIVDFDLRNTGTEPAVMLNPVFLQGTPALTVRGRSDAALTGHGPSENFSFDAEKVLAEGRRTLAEEKSVRLGPGETLHFRAGVRLASLPSQSYVLKLVYQSSEGKSGADAPLVGELFSEDVRVSVPAKTH